jgi:hypothetical protein
LSSLFTKLTGADGEKKREMMDEWVVGGWWVRKRDREIER